MSGGTRAGADAPGRVKMPHAPTPCVCGGGVFEIMNRLCFGTGHEKMLCKLYDAVFTSKYQVPTDRFYKRPRKVPEKCTFQKKNDFLDGGLMCVYKIGANDLLLQNIR